MRSENYTGRRIVNSLKVKIKKSRDDAVIPKYATEFSAGADLYACIDEPVEIIPGETAFISAGLALEIPEGFFGLVAARSGLASKCGIAPANKIGVIDSDYRGEVTVALFNHSNEVRQICPGERIAQIIIVPYYTAEFKELPELGESERGAGGFGSTGE